ncbi:Conjugative transposon protein TraL [Mucinivorans hirudinis]|uniref:Conjugative transposon protein TraL n=1 Tax=Mucinivorans hirudinis TaxID=1433126 RepID=A0A060RAR4_9BACT|nr:Conjugative transposon protein TraL [Mucinivorans hirudinis]
MIRRIVIKIQDWTEDKLRHLCGRITPEKRLAVILVMFLVFGITSLYIFVSAIYQIGKNEGQRIEIEHIDGLKLQQKDSINQFNFNNNGREQD